MRTEPAGCGGFLLAVESDGGCLLSVTATRRRSVGRLVFFGPGINLHGSSRGSIRFDIRAQKWHVDVTHHSCDGAAFEAGTGGQFTFFAPEKRATRRLAEGAKSKLSPALCSVWRSTLPTLNKKAKCRGQFPFCPLREISESRLSSGARKQTVPQFALAGRQPKDGWFASPALTAKFLRTPSVLPDISPARPARGRSAGRLASANARTIMDTSTSQVRGRAVARNVSPARVPPTTA